MASMHEKLARKFEREKIPSLEALALQLHTEDKELQEWRQRWTEVEKREAVRARKNA